MTSRTSWWGVGALIDIASWKSKIIREEGESKRDDEFSEGVLIRVQSRREVEYRAVRERKRKDTKGRRTI